MIASYGSLMAIPIVTWLMRQQGFGWLSRLVLATSYWLQQHVTTAEPDRQHLLVGIAAYRRLATMEFPDHLAIRSRLKKKEEKRMAIVDITIIPIGTETTSVSDYIADIHRVLARHQEKISYQLTPMSTLIEGELPVLFEVIQDIHEVPFKQGVQRVATIFASMTAVIKRFHGRKAASGRIKALSAAERRSTRTSGEASFRLKDI